jgi:ribonuclease J
MTTAFDPAALTFIPLGGCAEIGMNLNVYGYQGKWLIVDCGITFGDDRAPGADVILPDPGFLTKLKDDIIGLVATHAHEDHIGAIPYLWPQLKCPIYATGFTASVLKRKLAMEGFGREVPIHILPMSGTITLAPFDIQLITLTHSIPEPNAVVIRSKAGTILHTGDWKLDPMPIIGEATDEAALRKLAGEDILAMICDSTNVFVKDAPRSETDVKEALTRIVLEEKGRVAVSCFATNVARLHTIAEAAREAGRTAVLAGASLRRIYEAAHENGYLHDVPPFLDLHDAQHLAAHKVLYICTGTQGEPRSALARIARKAHPQVRLEKGDAVIFSSRVIPGNERAIGHIQNLFAASGVKVITDRQGDIHVSGHPGQQELRQMYDWVKPHMVIPVHGEMRHMLAQAELAKSAGVPDTLVVQNGDVVQLRDGKLQVVVQTKSGRLARNGSNLVDVKSDIYRELQKVLEHGQVVASLCLDSEGEIVAPLQMSALGLLERQALDELTEEIEDLIAEEFEELTDKQQAKDDVVIDLVRKTIRAVMAQETGKRPRVEVHLCRVED